MSRPRPSQDGTGALFLYTLSSQEEACALPPAPPGQIGPWLNGGGHLLVTGSWLWEPAYKLLGPSISPGFPGGAVMNNQPASA